MTGHQIRKLHQAQPFRAFDIHLADGRSSGRTIGIALADDTIEIIDLLLVTSLKPQPNGRYG